MRKFTAIILLFLMINVLFSSCSGPKFLLKEDAKIDTLHLELDLRIIQEYEYKTAILQKMKKFVDVYNSESHPFKLSLNSGKQTTSCQVKVVRVKFIRTKQNVIGTIVSAAGIGTAAALIATGFPVPFGWVYIPSARTTITPVLSNDISSVTDFQNVGISSVGMYRKLNKQIELQGNKFVKYMVSVVQTIEGEYLSRSNK
jgi:hypothetical protein